MPQRNSQNPIKALKEFTNRSTNSNMPGGKTKLGKSAGICHKCGAEVPPKPGFRFSSLKCPKCGSSMK